MLVKFSLYFTNHLNEVINLNEKIVDIEDGILEIQNNKLYNSLVFVTNGVYYKPDIVADLIERVEVRYKIDDGDTISEFFVIDSIEYLENKNIKVYCKSKTVKFAYKYSGYQNYTVQTTWIKDLLSKLLIDTTINTAGLTDIPFEFDYNIEKKSIEDVVNDLHKITLFDYYFYRGVLYFEDKKMILEDDEAVKRYKESSDIIEFSTSTDKENIKINKIVINDTTVEELTTEPQMILEINDSPQCCSPDSVITFTDDGNTYKINTVHAYFLVYYSPLISQPTLNIEHQHGERIVIEKYRLTNDTFVRLLGGIKEVIAIDGVNNHFFIPNYNVVTFDNVEDGELKITYKTDVLYGTIKHSRYPKDIDFRLKFFDQEIDYTHKIELKGYYPKPYNYTINLVSDWGIDYNNAINGSVSVSKLNSNKAFVNYTTLSVNDFGEANFSITKYGTYKLERSNQEPLFFDYFINKCKFYMNEVIS